MYAALIPPVLGCSEHARFEDGAVEAYRRRHARFDGGHALSLIERYTDAVFPPRNLGGKAANEYRFARVRRENDAEIPVDAKHGPWRFDLLGPVGPSCTNVESFGTQTKFTEGTAAARERSGLDFERKAACGLTEYPEGCVVISVGSNGQFNFEADVVRRTRCRVAVFDCTVDPGRVVVPRELRPRVELFYKCLGTFRFGEKSERNRVYDWGRRRYVDLGLQRHHFISYAQALEMARVHGPPAFLKMDIEGYEWEVLPTLMSRPDAAPQQIAIELHFETQMPGLPWFGRLKSPTELMALGLTLRHNGFFIVSRQDNRLCFHCTELLLVRDPCSNNSSNRWRVRPAGARLLEA